MVYEAISCCVSFSLSLIIVNISPIFTSIFQMKHIPAVKFLMDYEKSMSFPFKAKSQKNGKSLKIGPSSLKD